jgi:hypothetical protein
MTFHNNNSNNSKTDRKLVEFGSIGQRLEERADRGVGVELVAQ